MLLIATVFFGPLAIASWMYFSGSLQPQGRTNHGALLEPISNLPDELPHSGIGKLGEGYWLLVYSNDGECDLACDESLYTIGQARKMLGKEMDRLKRLFLHDVSSPDTVDFAVQHIGLLSMSDAELSDMLNNKVPATLASGGYFLIDPLGNLVMYFEPELDPGDMVKDIQRLLKFSRIG